MKGQWRTIESVMAGLPELVVKDLRDGLISDWVARMPDAFVASAVADPGYAVYMAIRDLRDNLMKGEVVKHYGVHYPEAVRLALGEGVPAGTKAILERYRERIAAGGIEIPEKYDGSEFSPG